MEIVYIYIDICVRKINITGKEKYYISLFNFHLNTFDCASCFSIAAALLTDSSISPQTEVRTIKPSGPIKGSPFLKTSKDLLLCPPISCETLTF